MSYKDGVNAIVAFISELCVVPFFGYVVNTEKFHHLNTKVNCLMCQVDYLSDRNPWWLGGYRSKHCPCYKQALVNFS
jgi:hypothetical protein